MMSGSCPLTFSLSRTSRSCSPSAGIEHPNSVAPPTMRLSALSIICLLGLCLFSNNAEAIALRRDKLSSGDDEADEAPKLQYKSSLGLRVQQARRRSTKNFAFVPKKLEVLRTNAQAKEDAVKASKKREALEQILKSIIHEQKTT